MLCKVLDSCREGTSSSNINDPVIALIITGEADSKHP